MKNSAPKSIHKEGQVLKKAQNLHPHRGTLPPMISTKHAGIIKPIEKVARESTGVRTHALHATKLRLSPTPPWSLQSIAGSSLKVPKHHWGNFKLLIQVLVQVPKNNQKGPRIREYCLGAPFLSPYPPRKADYMSHPSHR